MRDLVLGVTLNFHFEAKGSLSLSHLQDVNIFSVPTFNSKIVYSENYSGSGLLLYDNLSKIKVV